MQESNSDTCCGLSMNRRDRKERIKTFWDLVLRDGGDGLARLHIHALRKELAIVEEYVQYNGKAHKYLSRLLNMDQIKKSMDVVKDQIAYRTILGEYNGKKQ